MPELESFEAVNDRTLKLMRTVLRNSDGNVLFSPLNLMTTLMMAVSGARGATLHEAAEALGIPETEIPGLVKQLLDSLARGNGRSHQTHYAAWFANGLEVRDEYVRTLKDSFGGKVGHTDFSRSEETASMINAEIARYTSGMVRDLVSPDDFSEITKMVLLGTLYFCGFWVHPFDRNDTEDKVFHLPDGGKKSLPMMFQAEFLPYFHSERDGVHGVILPCKKSDNDVIVLMTDDPAVPVSALIDKLDGPTLAAWIGSADADQRVLVTLPRFALTHSITGLQEILKKAGFAALFSDSADLSGICTQTPLKLEQIIHAVRLEIDEEGARAAAATMIYCAEGAPPSKPRELRADRPFLLLIRHNKTGQILFAASIADPDPSRPRCQ